jgi:hypothetical protein
MPDFAVIPELPAGAPINANVYVARVVEVATVLVARVPAVTVVSVDVARSPCALTVGAERASPGDVGYAAWSAPAVSVQAVESASAAARGV